MSAFVLDASIAAVWCLQDEQSPLAERALDMAERMTILVPTLFWFEVRNMLVMNERRGRLDVEQTLECLASLERLTIETDTVPSSDQVLTLARGHGLTIYDAAYLELARRRSAPLATLDRRLAAAASSAGVTLLAVA